MPKRKLRRGSGLSREGAAECPPAGHATAIFAVGQRSVAILGESVVGREEVQPQARQAPGAQPGGGKIYEFPANRAGSLEPEEVAAPAPLAAKHAFAG